MNDANIQIFKVVWQGIPITIKYNPNWSKAFERTQGYIMTHAEIIRDDGKQLPFTGTGYRSHFMKEFDLDDYSGITEYVIAWLDHESQSKKWKSYATNQNQLKLF